jgi:hypothetical protein
MMVADAVVSLAERREWLLKVSTERASALAIEAIEFFLAGVPDDPHGVAICLFIGSIRLLVQAGVPIESLHATVAQHAAEARAANDAAAR